MDKRYQVFVSSTYEDLKEERSKAITALLELNCIPSGMELFPSADEDSWNWIEQAINECDYYILIVGGRYGSMDINGIGYTEKEFRYAHDKGIPCLAFLHENLAEIPSGKTDRDSPEIKEKYDSFIHYVKSLRNYKPWSNPDSLKSAITSSISILMKRKPAIGWVRADKAEDVKAPEILKLKDRIAILEKEVSQYKAKPLIDGLAQGKDIFTFTYTRFRYYDGVKGKKTIKASWDDHFKTFGPIFRNTYNFETIKKEMEKQFKNESDIYIEIDNEMINKIIFQFTCLGYIKRQKSKNGESYWTLTSAGELYLGKLYISKRDR